MKQAKAMSDTTPATKPITNPIIIAAPRTGNQGRVVRRRVRTRGHLWAFRFRRQTRHILARYYGSRTGSILNLSQCEPLWDVDNWLHDSLQSHKAHRC